MNRQPWHFVLVRDPERLRQLADLAEPGRYIANAATALIVFVNARIRLRLIDGTEAAQDMILGAWQEGVGSCSVGVFHREKIEQMNRAPVDLAILFLIALGYSAKNAEELRGKKRKPPRGHPDGSHPLENARL